MFVSRNWELWATLRDGMLFVFVSRPLEFPGAFSDVASTACSGNKILLTVLWGKYYERSNFDQFYLSIFTSRVRR